MDDRLALRRVRQRIEELEAERSGCRTALTSFEQLAERVDAALAADRATGSDDVETDAEHSDDSDQGDATSLPDVSQEFDMKEPPP